MLKSHRSIPRAPGQTRRVGPGRSLALGIGVVISIAAVAAMGAHPAHAAVVITVTGTSGAVVIDGVCDLREAVQAANTNSLVDTCNGQGGNATDVIHITATGTILQSLGPMLITQPVSIIGPGANLLAIDGQNATMIFKVISGQSAKITGLTLQHGFTDEIPGGGDGDGGGGAAIRSDGDVILDDVAIIDNVNGSLNCVGCSGSLLMNTGTKLTMTNSVVSGNITRDYGFGGGIFLNTGTSASLTNVTIVNNSITNVNSLGGGLGANGLVSLNNVTISGNSAGFGGGAYFGEVASVTNSIIAGNSATLAGPDCFPSASAVVNSLDYNLVGDPSACMISGTTTHNITGVSALLGALGDNGGSTRTMALGAGSPAIDAANDSTCAPTDQRGTARPIDGDGANGAQCDIGAYEFVQQLPPAPTTTAGVVIVPATTTVDTVVAPLPPDPSTTPGPAQPTTPTSAVEIVGPLPETGSNGDGVGVAIVLLTSGLILVMAARRLPNSTRR
jgi:hypothetical protein